ncbi:MAG: TRAP transporter substrate-binding protein [Eubacteriales bacterium]|nr:TRAP transporter substrate-binding protein [Eubacteriales bacterium]
MKKFLVVIALLLTMSLLTACGGKKPEPTAAPAAKETVTEKTTEAEKPAAEVKQGEFVITMSHATADTTSLHAGSVKFKEYVEKESGGRIKVNIYPNAQLGGDRETIEGTQAGQITMMSSSNAVQVNFVPSAVIFDIPFIYPNLEFARKVLADEAFIKAISAEYEKNGLRYVGTSDQGFRTLTTNKEVRTPADMSGITLRTMENKYHMALWRNIGANPTPLPFNELYTALQQGTADGQENPVELIYSQKFFEQQKYVVYTNHILQTIVWIMNNEFYTNLPDDMKAVVDEGSKVALAYANEFQDNNVASYTKTIEDYGVKFVELTEEERLAFAEEAKPVWDMVEKDCDPGVYSAYMNAVKAAEDSSK